MLNENDLKDIENQNTQTLNYQNQSKIGDYDQKGRYNPWIKKTQLHSLNYTQFDQQNQRPIATIQKRACFKWKSFSAINLVLILIYYLVECALIANTKNTRSCIFFNLGALYQPSITYNYEFQRLFLPNFLHNGFIHIFYNSISLYYFGQILEEFYGFKKFAILYIFAGLGGNIFQGYYHPESLAVGASSSIFGFFPLILLYLKQNQNVCRKQKIIYSIYIILMILFSFIGMNQSYESQQISVKKKGNIGHGAHLGGLFTGFFIALIYSQSNSSVTLKSKLIKITSFVILVLSFGQFFFYNQFNFDIKSPKQLELACQWK
ncbi:hypothetical protein ABPG74_002504 [Tetrahymena malaccensis]